MADINAGKAPNGETAEQSVQEMFGKLRPLLETLIDLYAKAAPHIERARQLASRGWRKVGPYWEQYWEDSYLEAVFGVALLFFGGTFALTVSCFMAVRLSGWETIKKSWNVLRANYRAGMEAFARDPAAQRYFDRDGDGVVSGAEMGRASMQLLSGSAEQKRLILTNLRCVLVAIEPAQVMAGMGGLWATVVAVIATLRSSMASNVALGVSLGSMASTQLGRFAKPWIGRRLDSDMKKWADFALDAVCRLVGVTVALLLMRVVSALHSALLGGQMVSTVLFAVLAKRKLVPVIEVKNTAVFLACSYGLAAIGFWFQLSRGFGLNSIVLRLLLLPLSITEAVLTWLAVY